MCGEDVDILESFDYPDSVNHNNGESRQVVSPWIGLAHGVMHEYMALSVPVQTDKDSNLQVAGDPCIIV